MSDTAPPVRPPIAAPAFVALHERAFDVVAFRAAIGAGELPVDEDRAAGILAAGRLRIGRDDAVDDRLDGGRLLGREIEPRAWPHRRRRRAGIGMPGQAARNEMSFRGDRTDRDVRGGRQELSTMDCHRCKNCKKRRRPAGSSRGGNRSFRARARVCDRRSAQDWARRADPAPKRRPAASTCRGFCCILGPKSGRSFWTRRFVGPRPCRAQSAPPGPICSTS